MSLQLAISIIANAVDAAPPRTAIDIRLKSGPTLAIEDRGTGIAPDNLARLFEPFYTTKLAGAGLGLAIGHEIARARGARIDVRSRPAESVTRSSMFRP